MVAGSIESDGIPDLYEAIEAYDNAARAAADHVELLSAKLLDEGMSEGFKAALAAAEAKLPPLVRRRLLCGSARRRKTS